MTRTRLILGLLIFVALHPTPLFSQDVAMQPDTLALGGSGGLYLLAEKGELVIELYKQDRQKGADSDLRALLLGPDRRLLDDIIIYGNGSATLSTVVEHRGVYVVNVTAAKDRYGEKIWWGFRTNSAQYLIETSRGHRDARHMEPIVLGTPATAMDVCFLPRQGAIAIEVSGLPVDSPPLSLFGAEGEPLAELEVSAEGTAFWSGVGDRQTDNPWRLHLPKGEAILQIDGLTRWQRGEPLENLSLWSPRREAFFALHDLRWLLTPYSHAFAARAGVSHEVSLRLHNNGPKPDTIIVEAESSSLDVALATATVLLAPGEARSVIATVEIPDTTHDGERLSARIIARSTRHPNIDTWTTIEARVGPPAPLSFEIPLVYRPYEHENEQFAYTPDYPNDNQLYFAPDNTAFARGDDGIYRLDEKTWRFIGSINGKRYRAASSKIAFGAGDEVCLLGFSGDSGTYLYSNDGGDSFAATEAFTRQQRRRQVDIESFAGHNLPAGPAPFVLATETSGSDPEHFWRRVNDLELYLPRLEEGRIVFAPPILVSRQAIGISSHSGVPSSIASYGDRVHVIWGEATDPEGDEPGVPAYVATWDRSEKRWLGEKVLVGYGPPANDVHNTPSLVVDSEGYLHTLTGTHGSPFAYARSLEPNTAHAGFTEPELIEEELRSTYVGLVCDPDDTLHLIFRVWTDDGLYHPTSHYANLGYKRKRKGEAWEDMRRLAVAPFSEYSIWYHRLTIDRRGRLFVSFDYWSTFWFYRNDHIGHRRKTIMSPDGGDSWQLLRTQDL